jgi:hypothetical protein
MTSNEKGETAVGLALFVPARNVFATPRLHSFIKSIGGAGQPATIE